MFDTVDLPCFHPCLLVSVRACLALMQNTLYLTHKFSDAQTLVSRSIPAPSIINFGDSSSYRNDSSAPTTVDSPLLSVPRQTISRSKVVIHDDYFQSSSDGAKFAVTHDLDTPDVVVSENCRGLGELCVLEPLVATILCYQSSALTLLLALCTFL